MQKDQSARYVLDLSLPKRPDGKYVIAQMEITYDLDIGGRESTGPIPIEMTYSRWKSSDTASEGEQCQDCHMPPYAGSAAPNVSKMKRDAVHAHGFPAARTPGFLDSVVTMTAVPDGKSLTLTITNRRAGHSLPGGGGGMRVIDLAVSFFGAKGESLGLDRVQTYGIRYADAKGVTPVPKWLASTVAHPRSSAFTASRRAGERWVRLPAVICSRTPLPAIRPRRSGSRWKVGLSSG